MTLAELYETIDGDYEKALRVLRMDKLIDKHIRKLTNNGVIDKLLAAGAAFDAVQLFESAHAAKGVCGNLGLMKLSNAASEIAEEFRPGSVRQMTDEEVKEKIAAIAALYERTSDGIRAYEEN